MSGQPLPGCPGSHQAACPAHLHRAEAERRWAALLTKDSVLLRRRKHLSRRRRAPSHGQRRGRGLQGLTWLRCRVRSGPWRVSRGQRGGRGRAGCVEVCKGRFIAGTGSHATVEAEKSRHVPWGSRRRPLAQLCSGIWVCRCPFVLPGPPAWGRALSLTPFRCCEHARALRCPILPAIRASLSPAR